MFGQYAASNPEQSLVGSGLRPKLLSNHFKALSSRSKALSRIVMLNRSGPINQSHDYLVCVIKCLGNTFIAGILSLDPSVGGRIWRVDFGTEAEICFYGQHDVAANRNSRFNRSVIVRHFGGKGGHDQKQERCG